MKRKGVKNTMSISRGESTKGVLVVVVAAVAMALVVALVVVAEKIEINVI
jgi:hypothetical protein